MEDKLTPMEAEVLEIPMNPSPEGLDTYGTAPKPRPKRSFVGLWICIGLLVIAVCTSSIVAAVYHVHFVHDSNGWQLTMQNPGETPAQNPVKDLQLPESEGSASTGYVRNTAGQIVLGLESESTGPELTPSALYERVKDSIVCLELQTYYGTVYETGVVISADGYILTALADTGDTISASASFSGGKTCSARLIGEDRTTGICVLKIEESGLHPLPFSAGDKLAVGSTVYSVENPYGTAIPNVFSTGMISARQEVAVDGAVLTLLQTSNALSGYGCPILNSRGCVVGITTPVGSRILSGTVDPCFAVSSRNLQTIVSLLTSDQNSGTCWLGFEVQEIPKEYQVLWGYPEGLWISEVGQGTRVDGVLCPYDIILSLDGEEVKTAKEYEQLLARKKPGDTAEVIILRNGKRYLAQVPVTER